jgi:ubiquinone/menaquinone biosynthesis C-methylase UbiE
MPARPPDNRSHWSGRGRDATIDGWASRLYDRLAPWLLRRFYRHVAAEVAAVVPPDGTVLDAGTGPGLLLVELANRRPDLRLTGVDLSTDMVTRAQRNIQTAGHSSRVEVRPADVAALPFGEGSFDLVVSTFSMHHWRAVPPAVAELARVLRPGGALWIYDFRIVPDDALAAAAGEAFDRQPLRRTIPPVGRLLGRLSARWAVLRPATAEAPTPRSQP